MPHPDPQLHKQFPLIRRVVQDETWLEGERRGCRVESDDPQVRLRVADVILRIGGDLRRRCEDQDPPA